MVKTIRARARPRPYSQSYKGIMVLPIPHIGHKHHLCYLIEDGHVTLEELKYLVGDAKYLCRKCGRSASNDANLCEPTPL